MPPVRIVPGRCIPRPPLVQSFDNLDRLLHAFQARLTHGIPTAAAAWMDWLAHLANAPGRQLTLQQKALTDAAQLALYWQRAMTGPAPVILPQPGDQGRPAEQAERCDRRQLLPERLDGGQKSGHGQPARRGGPYRTLRRAPVRQTAAHGIVMAAGLLTSGDDRLALAVCGAAQSANGSRIKIVSSRSGLVESSATGHSTNSSRRLTYFTAWAGSWAKLRAPLVLSDQPSSSS